MTEITPTPESQRDKLPSLDTVLAGFDKFLEGAEITKVLKQVEDEEGLYVYEVEAKLPNGDAVECLYKRARQLWKSENGAEVPSRIHTMLYDADGMPSGAGPQFDFINGEWIEIT